MKNHSLIAGVLSLSSFSLAANVVTVEDFQRAERTLSKHTKPLVTNTVEGAQWLNSDELFYRTQTAAGHAYVIASANEQSKRQAFDHKRLASAIKQITKEDINENELSLRRVTFSEDEKSITFYKGKHYLECSIEKYRCNELDALLKSASISPDGKKAVYIKDNNLWVRDIKRNSDTQLTKDGTQDFGWSTNNAGWIRSNKPVVSWSPDSTRIKTFKHDGREVGEMYLVSTNVGHPTLDAWKYPLPGDKKIFEMHRAIIDVTEGVITEFEMAPDAHRSTVTDHVADWSGNLLDVEWSDDGSKLAFVSVSRDHKTATLREFEKATGKVRTILSETTKTYYESGYKQANWHYLPDSNEVIWFSERSNWGHLYLYDLTTGELKNQITKGDWAVLQVLKVDVDNRQIYFTAGGKEEDRDPYFHHLYKVNFDGSKLTLLTPENAHHTVKFSASGNFFLDQYSTPNMPGDAVIRDLQGRRIYTVEKTDISELLKTNWQPPKPFTVKARDGKTDLYGLMFTPSNLDESKKYPVVNYLYPGPQSGSIRGRSFTASRRDHQALAELGFVVVVLDAMGTPGRSKSFHDVYYGNMGDNGLPDQVAGIKELAQRHKWMDLDRVGIWGHSGGGFASTRAMFDYPDFYKVAVSGAGNHDNRNYADAWGEKWQGLLTNGKKGTTNYDNQANQLAVENLKGKLLLAHGTADDNVPHYNSLLVVDALIAANKDFDMLLLPNRGHGFANEAYMMRKRWEYFIDHLLKAERPKEYKIGQLK